MNLDKLQLPALLHKHIFRNYLVDLKPGINLTVLTSEPKVEFLGGNEKKIIFLFNDDKNKFLPDSQMKFLSDLLTACHLNMADIAIVNIHNSKITYRNLTEQLQPEKILIFGVPDILDLPFNIPFFQIQNYQLVTYITFPLIAVIQKDLELKKQLWVCLQKIFRIQSQK